MTTEVCLRLRSQKHQSYGSKGRTTMGTSMSVMSYADTPPDEDEIEVSPTFIKQRARYKSGSGNLACGEAVDPTKVPLFSHLTALRRELVTDIPHWGRSGMTEYSAQVALAGDRSRSTSGFPTDGDMKHAEANMNVEREEFAKLRGTTLSSTGASHVHADFERIAGKALDCEVDILTQLRNALENKDERMLLGFHSVFNTLGYYALLEHMYKSQVAILQAAVDPMDSTLSDAYHALGVALQKQGLHADAESYLTKAHAARTANVSTPGEIRAAVESCVQLGACLRAQKRLVEACERLEKAVDLSREWDQADVLRMLVRSEYAVCLAGRGRVDEAKEYAVYGIDALESRDVLVVLANMAEYALLSEDVECAVAQYQGIWMSLARVLGPFHVDTLRAKRDYAVVSDNEEELKELVAAWTQIYGEISVESLCAVHDLAVYHIRQQDYTTARAMLESTHSSMQRTLGVYHRSSCHIASKIADTFCAENRPEAAEWFVRDVHGTLESNLGPQASDTRKAANNVACVLFRQFKRTEAEEIWKASTLPWVQELCPLMSTEDDVFCLLALQNYCHLVSYICQQSTENEGYRKTVWSEWSRMLGPEHPNTLMAMQYYGVCLRDLRQLDRAQEVLRKCWDLRRRIHGEEHPETLQTEFNLAAALKLSLEYDEAKALHDHAYQCRLRILGPQHTDTSASEYYLSLWYLAQDDLVQSERMQRKCLAGYTASYGPEHFWTLHSKISLGASLASFDDENSKAECSRLFEEAVAGLTKLFGEAHWDTMRPLAKLAHHKCYIGAYDEAIGLWKRVVQNSEVLYGTYAPRTVVAVCNLVLTFDDALQSDGAIEYYPWIRRGWEEVQQAPAAEMEPEDFSSLGFIEETVKNLPERGTASRMTLRATQTMCRQVGSAFKFLGL